MFVNSEIAINSSLFNYTRLPFIYDVIKKVLPTSELCEELLPPTSVSSLVPLVCQKYSLKPIHLSTKDILFGRYYQSLLILSSRRRATSAVSIIDVIIRKCKRQIV